jgi:hypothetical protein
MIDDERQTQLFRDSKDVALPTEPGSHFMANMALTGATFDIDGGQ